MRKNRRWMWLALFLALSGVVILMITGFDNRLSVRVYEIKSEKLTERMRVVLLTDLHSCNYGEGQRELLDVVEAQAPDLILLGGDIIDDAASLPRERGYAAVEALAQRWPTYYVTGNHELWTNDAPAIRAELERRGAVVLRGESVSIGGISIAGVDDPDVGEEEWARQLAEAKEQTGAGTFTILLTHRPERVETYAASVFDLVLAGHAHGGQWRLSGLINGLIAPNQGLFPKYAGGEYDLGGTTLVVSRGLARESTRVPRIFNPPEVVVVDVVGK